MTKLAALFLICLTTTPTLSSEPVSFTINTKKWSHVLDEHFISITVNPTDLLQGKVYGLAMNSTMAILKGLAPAYVRIGSADTGKYTFKRNRYPSDVVKPDDEYTVTETHWMVFNEVAQSAGLDVIVCLNSAHRSEGTKKWDTRNSLELISFSDSQGYNLTWQLGYEVQAGEDLSGLQFGKDLNRLRTILNAFPRYQHSKLIGPDVRVIHKKEDVDFWNEVLSEAGPILDAVTWHPRWPQPSKMKVSDNSELGYEFPIDYLEWDKGQLSKILQKSIFKNPVWIGETKRESTGTFAEGLMWARRLVLAAKLGIEVVMKQPNLMDISHPKPEYWIALLHKRLLGKSVLETRSTANNTDLAVISHCTNPLYWSDKPEKLQDGPVTVYAVNMGGLEQKIQLKGTWTGKSQLLFQYVLTSGSDPDSVFSQMTYLNGEPLMMADDGMLPDIVPKIKKIERSLTLKLPPYSIGFWVVPEAKVKICQIQPQNIPTISVETLTPTNAIKSVPNNLQNIRDINQFLVEKLKNPESESEETKELKIEPASSESSEKDVKDLNLLSKENALPRVARRIRQVDGMDEINQQLKTIMKETQEFLSQPEKAKAFTIKSKLPKASSSMEERIQSLAEGISQAIKSTNQQQEFSKFLEDSGLKQDFGSLLMEDKKFSAPGMKNLQPFFNSQNPDGQFDEFAVKDRLRRSVSASEESPEDRSPEPTPLPIKFGKKIKLVEDPEEGNKNRKQDVVIPHNPDLKGLEERYKFIVHSKIQDGKRKIDGIKRKIKDEKEITQKIKPPEAVNDIQEEIIKKEIELLEKTEETVADILKNQKKRQETFQDMIFDELNDVKGERITALKEMHKNQRKKENAIVKRQVQAPLSRPLLKTVEYIEKNFNLEPESVRKIKRSLEERMGDILRNYDTKKSLESKPRSKPQKEERKTSSKRPAKEEDWDEPSEKPARGRKTERVDDDDDQRRDRPKEKNFIKKTSGQVGRNGRKSEDMPHRSRRTEDARKKYEDDNDSFEMFNESKLQDNVRKPERKRPEKVDEKPSRFGKKTSKSSRKEDWSKEETEPEPKRKDKEIEEDAKKAPEIKKKRKEVEEDVKKPTEVEKNDEVEEESKSQPAEKSPLKNDKERRENMLKQITIMVDEMNSRERSDRLKRKPEDEDISEEFETDKRSRKMKRRPRRADAVEVIEEKPDVPVEKATGGATGGAAEGAPAVPPVVTSTSAPVTTTTQASKLNKLRKHRIRPGRRQKEGKKVSKKEEEATTGEEESQQRKRHLAPFDRPGLELEKKKIFKQKIRKLNPKFLAHENELLMNEKEREANFQQESFRQEETTQTARPPPEPETTETKTLPPNAELVKDLEEIAEEKIFLGRGSATSKEKSETNGREFSERKYTEKEVSAETPAPTEGYIIVEPTLEPEIDDLLKLEKKTIDQLDGVLQKVENAVEEVAKEEKKMADLELKPQDDPSDLKNQVLQEVRAEEKKDVPPSRPTEEEKSAPVATPTEGKVDSAAETIEPEKVLPAVQQPEAKPVPVVGSTEGEKKDAVSVEEIKSLEAVTEEETPEEPKSAFASNESSSLSSEETEEVTSPLLIQEAAPSEKALPKVGVDSSQRKRRATFLPDRGAEEDQDEDDYSSEERIQKFKQMIYRKSPTKKPIKNEIRSTSGMGMGADEFLRMAGSTVRVMFDDVIPEAYGQTKNKIQNMGIPEYIKEFGKIVQQMKNLDQIFLNIGEAAVKGYIKGNRAEKGPYIQVISRKKRGIEKGEGSANGISLSEEASETEETFPPASPTTDSAIPRTTPENDERPKTPEYGRTTERDVPPGGIQYARTGTGEKIAADRRGNHWEAGSSGRNHRESVHEDDQTGSLEHSEDVKKEEKEEKPQAPKKRLTEEKSTVSQEVMKTGEGSFSEKPIFDFESLTSPIKSFHEKIPKIAKRLKQNNWTDYRVMLRDTGLVGKSSPISEDLQERISPWIKTTKDFIQQALTTLQRQRQLSEILARESINDLMNREMVKKSIGKREVGEEEEEEDPKLPVYHVTHPEKETKKREAREKQSEESLIRHLRGLQPGVYVVPTEEMTNIRSEQITNESKQKSGMPNVVTLNIYYDKKNQDASEAAGKTETTAETSEQRLANQDVVAYYQNKAWKTAAEQYDPTQYLSVPEVNLPTPLITPIQVNPALQTSAVFTAEPRLGELPNSRLVQYPTPTYHYPPVQKMYPPIVPNPQPVYNPVYYLPQDNRFLPPPPGTKRQWREFKARAGGVPPMPANYNSGWNIQYETVPGSGRTSSKILPTSYNKNFKLYADKKRSVGDFKIDPTWSESALPFWKFFTTSSADKKIHKTNPKNSVVKPEAETVEEESSEDVFADNRKRAKEAENVKDKAETVTEEPVPEEEEEEKSRRRRSVEELPEKHPRKRSYPYEVDFRDHDILPEWFGTYQEIGNSLDHLPAHVRRSHIVSTPWSEEDEELLSILDADDELSLVDLDDSDDYYYSNDNTISHLRRYPRSTDQFENNMIKSNMIYKKPVDGDRVKSKVLGMTGIKKLTDEDSSLELVTKTLAAETKTTPADASKKPEEPRRQQPQQTATQSGVPVTTTQATANHSQVSQNQPPPDFQARNPHDDTFYYFFKYAYDSLVKVMKSMTELF